MALNENIGRFAVRRSLRFELKPLYATEEHLEGYRADDEDRAAVLNTMKSLIEAEHLTAVRRVFKALSDPLPSDPKEIQQALKADPEFSALTDTNPRRVTDLFIERCNYHHWTLPRGISELAAWPSLYVKWHWFCKDRFFNKFGLALAREWAGRTKADVMATSSVFRNPPKRKPSRNYWYDHGPFRMMFGNRLTGYSWLKDDFSKARQFLLLDPQDAPNTMRILVGVVPRSSKVNPFTMPQPLPVEQSYQLYVEESGQAPKLKTIPRALIDAAAHRGSVFLFEVSGRAIRNHTNQHALLLKALLSEANFKEQIFHLDRNSEFFARKGCPFNEKKPDGFRQRYADGKHFVEFQVTLNAHLVGTGKAPASGLPVRKLVESVPYARILFVKPCDGGYRIEGWTASGERFMLPKEDEALVPTAMARSGHLVGRLARLCVDQDAYVLLSKDIPPRLTDAIESRFAYVSFKDRERFADGGIFKGYQLTNRIYAGTLADLQSAHTAQQEAATAVPKSNPPTTPPKTKKPKDGRHALTEAEIDEKLKDSYFTEGLYLFSFGYRLSDNVERHGQMKASSRAEVHEKSLRLGVNATGIVCIDPAIIASRLPLKPIDVGSTEFNYTFRDKENNLSMGTLRADTKSEAFAKLRSIGIKAIRVLAEGETYEPKAYTHHVSTPEEIESYRAKLKEGALEFAYEYRSPDNVRHIEKGRANTRDELYDKLRLLNIRPCRVAPCQPPTSASQPVTIADRLKRLVALHEQGILSDAEYAEQRVRIISEL